MSEIRNTHYCCYPGGTETNGRVIATWREVGPVTRKPRGTAVAGATPQCGRWLSSGRPRCYGDKSKSSPPLSDYQVVAFATHGLVAGELEGVSEPALVLTPPAEETETDDGLLIASVLTHLKLNADWVILSACNTAATDGTPGARGLSGLTKAFFHAGSRALIVSHWPVVSDAAVALTTRILAAAKTVLTRAEAHRQAMLAMIDTGPAQNAPLAQWAPFIVVGEGGIRHAQ